MSRTCRRCRTNPPAGVCPLCDCVGGIPAELLAAFPEVFTEDTP